MRRLVQEFDLTGMSAPQIDSLYAEMAERTDRLWREAHKGEEW